jgi:hypothetical protein
MDTELVNIEGGSSPRELNVFGSHGADDWADFHAADLQGEGARCTSDLPKESGAPKMTVLDSSELVVEFEFPNEDTQRRSGALAVRVVMRFFNKSGVLLDRFNARVACPKVPDFLNILFLNVPVFHLGGGVGRGGED